MKKSDTRCAEALLKALSFAARQHRDQRRKDPEALPYINHPIEVAEVLARVGSVDDIAVLQAAVLHDTVEDTKTRPEDLEREFGAVVRKLVEEVSDDKSLPKETRKRLQIEHAPFLSSEAKLIKLADKICNVRDVAHAPPKTWDEKRRREYLDWADAVVAGCRGTNRALETHFDAVLHEARTVMDQSSRSTKVKV